MKFLWWATHEGQSLAQPLDYAPLPQPVVAKVAKTVETLQVEGKPVRLAQQ